MPELPEVETVVRTLEQLIKGKTIKDIEIYWDNIIERKEIDSFKEVLIGQTFQDFSRRGKYLLFGLDHTMLVVHLRMEGKFYYYKTSTPKEKHTHVIFFFTDGSELHYHDVRKFGKMYLYPLNEGYICLDKLGKEPFDEELTVEYLITMSKNKRISIKQFLLDQSVIAGIGNIYADEICFLAKINPKTTVDKISKKKWIELLQAVQTVLKEAIEQGGTTIRSYTSSLGVTGLFQQQLNAYGRFGKPCVDCGTLLQKTKITGRTTVFCPTCQKVKK